MPQSIEELIKESKELVERSRELRARSRQATTRFGDVMRRSDSLSDDASRVMRQLDDLRKENRSQSEAIRGISMVENHVLMALVLKLHQMAV